MSEAYPLVGQLPPFVEAGKWDWRPFKAPLGGRDFFWATDEAGNRWLTKVRGSFYGYRELVFERLAQRAGWLCQSSCFAILDAKSLPRRAKPGAERIQLVTSLLPEHPPHDCGISCPISALRGDLWELSPDPVLLLAESSLADALNHPRGEILAPVLGGNEPAQGLTTVDHRRFLIDGEQMFSERASDPRITGWWQRPDGTPYAEGQRLTRAICTIVGSFSDSDLESFLEKPPELRIKQNWSIRRLLYYARDCAHLFTQSHSADLV